MFIWEWIVAHWVLSVYAAISFGMLVETGWLYAVVVSAKDVDWGKDPNAHLVSIDYDKAKRRLVGVPMLALPMTLGVIVLGGIFVASPTLYTYISIATFCFLTAPVRRFWSIAAARKAYTHRTGKTLDHTAWEDYVYYYQWGMYPEKPTMFVGKFAKYNKYRTVFMFLRFWRFWGILGQAAISALWLPLLPFAPFFYSERVDEYDLKPWWRLYRKAPKPPRTIEGQATVTGDDPIGSTSV